MRSLAWREYSHIHADVGLVNCVWVSQVLDAMDRYYETSNANVHRGAHALSIRATEAYEAARDKVQVRQRSPKIDF